MNTIFSRIWNAHKGCWVACSEKAKSCRKTGGISRSQLQLLTSISLISIPSAFALPTGGNVTSGTGNIQVFDNGKQLSVNQSSDKIIINWDKFGIKADEKVRFNQPSQNSVALNRVLGLEGTMILGQLSGNGKVFIINPNGIAFGNGSQINVGGLLASTQNISDSDFNSGNYKFSGISRSTIINQGAINSTNGNVILLANQVRNTGTINTPNSSTVLAAGSAFTLSLDGAGLVNVKVDSAIMDALVHNSNKISANGGQVILTARDSSNLMKTVVNNSGTIEANTLNFISGKIVLDAGPKDRVDVSGQISASAQGKNMGDGGSIDISGKNARIGLSTLFNTSADNGKTGLVSIKADDFQIASRGNSSPYSDSYISSDTLSQGLAYSNFSITNVNGDLAVNGLVSWANQNKLELNALNNVLINDVISSTGKNATLTLNPGSDNYILAKGKYIRLAGSDTTFRINNKSYKVIQNFDQLQRINSNLYGLYVLGNDIDGANKKFDSIASGSNPYTSFQGVLDGLGHVVTRLAITSTGPNSGLIAMNDGTLKNISLTASTVSNTASNVPAAIGALIGYNRGNLINSSSNIYFQAALAYDQINSIGGLVGINSGTIDSSTFSGTISGNAATRGIGGIAGENSRGTISNSTNTGLITGRTHYNPGFGTGAGGLVGINVQGSVQSSINTGNVKVNYSSNSGGLIGLSLGGIITDSSSSGSVGISYNSANSDYIYSRSAGGLIGYLSNGTVLNSRSNSVVEGGTGTVAGGLIGTNFAGTISNVATNSTVNNSRGQDAGGLIGINNLGDVTDAVAAGIVNGGHNTSVGGLIGSNNDGNVSNSAVRKVTAGGAISKISASYKTNLGGAIGTNTGTVTGVSAENSVVGDISSNVGGLVGLNGGSLMEGVISFSNSYGNVTSGSSSSTGGLVGFNRGLISNSYSYSDISSGSSSKIGGLIGINDTIGRVVQAQTYGKVSYLSTQTYGGAIGINMGSIEDVQVLGDAVRLNPIGVNRGIVRD